MAIGVFREVAHRPLAVAPPEVPSVGVLSDDDPAVLPDTDVVRMQQVGWTVRRLSGIHHDMQLEDATRTFDAIADVL